MEIILTIVLITSVITNLITIRSVKKIKLFPEAKLQPILESTGCNCGVVLAEEIKEVLLPLYEARAPETPVKMPQPQDESHKAWRNQKEEPLVAPASPHGPPPPLDPLARPYGFSR